ncbi:MAG: hypothetical protein ACK4K9_11645 [Bacteroidia bacterium]
MKKIFIELLSGIALTSLIAFKVATYEAKRSTAEVEQYQGVFVFTDSKPVMPYDYLGTVKSTVGWDSQYEGVRDKLIGKAKKEFPTADGLIFHFKSGGTDRCDAIKFK